MTAHAFRLDEADAPRRAHLTTAHTLTESHVPKSVDPESEPGATSETAAVLRAHGVGVKGGMSGAQLAARAGVSTETINRHLRPVHAGKRPPSMDRETIDTIADAVPMPRSVLTNAVLRDAGFMVESTTPDGAVTVDELITYLPGLNDHDRRVLLAELAQLVARGDSTAE